MVHRPPAPDKRSSERRRDEGPTDGPAAPRPPLDADLQQELRAARREAGELGRPDLAARRLIRLLVRDDGTVTTDGPAVAALQDLGQRVRGREARRLLYELWCHAGEDGRADDVLAAAARVGSPAERVDVLARLLSRRIDQRSDLDDALDRAHRRLDPASQIYTLDDVIAALQRAWELLEGHPRRWQVADLLARFCDRASRHEAALLARLSAACDAAIPAGNAARMLQRVLRDLDEDRPLRRLLLPTLIATRLPDSVHRELVYRHAVDLADDLADPDHALHLLNGLIERYGPEPDWIDARARWSGEPGDLAASVALSDDLEFIERADADADPFAAEPTRHFVPTRRPAAPGDIDGIDDLERRAYAPDGAGVPADRIAALSELADHYRRLDRVDDELRVRGDLAEQLTDRHAQADQFRRCAELLATADHMLEDALRVRVEACVLDTPTDDDREFIDALATRANLVEVAQEQLFDVAARSSGPARHALAELGTALGDPDETATLRITERLVALWVDAPEDEALAKLMLLWVAQTRHRQPLLEALGNPRVTRNLGAPAVIDQLVTALTTPSVPDHRASVLVAGLRRQPLNEHYRALLIQAVDEHGDRMFALQAFRSVYDSTQSLDARKEWARVVAETAEEAGAFEVAANHWAFLLPLSSERDQLFVRIVRNFERAGAWARLSLFYEDELARCTDPNLALELAMRAANLFIQRLREPELGTRLMVRTALQYPDHDALAVAATGLLDNAGMVGDQIDFLRRRGHRLKDGARSADCYLAAARLALDQAGDADGASDLANLALKARPGFVDARDLLDAIQRSTANFERVSRPASKTPVNVPAVPTEPTGGAVRARVRVTAERAMHDAQPAAAERQPRVQPAHDRSRALTPPQGIQLNASLGTTPASVHRATTMEMDPLDIAAAEQALELEAPSLRLQMRDVGVSTTSSQAALDRTLQLTPAGRPGVGMRDVTGPVTTLATGRLAKLAERLQPDRLVASYERCRETGNALGGALLRDLLHLHDMSSEWAAAAPRASSRRPVMTLRDALRTAFRLNNARSLMAPLQALAEAVFATELPPLDRETLTTADLLVLRTADELDTVVRAIRHSEERGLPAVSPVPDGPGVVLVGDVAWRRLAQPEQQRAVAALAIAQSHPLCYVGTHHPVHLQAFLEDVFRPGDSAPSPWARQLEGLRPGVLPQLPRHVDIDALASAVRYAPWAVCLVATGAFEPVYRRLMAAETLARATTLDQLVEQAAESPLLSDLLLFTVELAR